MTLRQLVASAVTLFVLAYVYYAVRDLTIAMVSDGFERSSLEELDGDLAPLVRWFDYPGVPAGEYDIVAVVHRPGAHPWRAESRINVLGQ